jgi:hypothetical protein
MIPPALTPHQSRDRSGPSQVELVVSDGVRLQDPDRSEDHHDEDRRFPLRPEDPHDERPGEDAEERHHGEDGEGDPPVGPQEELPDPSLVVLEPREGGVHDLRHDPGQTVERALIEAEGDGVIPERLGSERPPDDEVVGVPLEVVHDVEAGEVHAERRDLPELPEAEDGPRNPSRPEHDQDRAHDRARQRSHDERPDLEAREREHDRRRAVDEDGDEIGLDEPVELEAPVEKGGVDDPRRRDQKGEAERAEDRSDAGLTIERGDGGAAIQVECDHDADREVHDHARAVGRSSESWRLWMIAAMVPRLWKRTGTDHEQSHLTRP